MLKIKTEKQTEKTKQNKTKQTNKQNKTKKYTQTKKTYLCAIKHAPRILVFLVSVLELKYFICFLQFIPYSLLLQELDIKNLRELEVMCLV